MENAILSKDSQSIEVLTAELASHDRHCSGSVMFRRIRIHINDLAIPTSRNPKSLGSRCKCCFCIQAAVCKIDALRIAADNFPVTQLKAEATSAVCSKLTAKHASGLWSGLNYVYFVSHKGTFHVLRPPKCELKSIANRPKAPACLMPCILTESEVLLAVVYCAQAI